MRVKKLGKVFVLILLMMAVILVGCNKNSGNTTDNDDDTVENNDNDTDNDDDAEEDATADEGDGTGGEIKVAINAQPPSLDPHMTTAGATSDISKMMFETLLTTDSGYNPVPMLAENIDVNDDNTEFIFTLRQGVNFHNGEEMTAEDVVASMNRWLELSGVAAGAFGDVEFEEVDTYTVKLVLNEPSSIALGVMASSEQFPAIMPKEIIESAPAEGVEEFIGTGPYEFAEWKQDQYIHVTKYDEYASLDTPADGLSGQKNAYIEDIYYYVVTDPSTRLAGIQSKEYDIAYSLPTDNYEQLTNMDDLFLLTQHTATMDLIYNKRGELMGNPKMRQAVNALLNIEEVLQASLVNAELYSMEASYMNSEIEQWATNAGEEFFNLNDPDKAQELLEEAGYDGETMIIMTTRDYEHYYNASVVIQEQLEKIGVNTDLQVYDWPTITERREEPDTWDLFVNAFPFKTDPTQLLQLNPSFAGGIADEKADGLLDDIATATSEEEASSIWEELQEYAWAEYVPMTRLASFGSVTAVLNHLEDLESSVSGTILWNAKIND